jgi:U3 small nucleolar RNA-associated protein 14
MGILASDTSSVTLRSTDILSPPASRQPRRSPTPEPATTESNPWLAPRNPDLARKAPKKNNEILLSKDSTASTKSKNKLKKQARKRAEQKKAKDDAVVEISTDNVLSPRDDAYKPTTGEATSESGKGLTTDGFTMDNDSDVNSEVEAQEKALDIKVKAKTKAPKAFEQRDLVALAFAGDNVVHVGFCFIVIGPGLHQHTRNSKKQNDVKLQQMLLVKSTLPFPAGYASFLARLQASRGL